MILYKDLTQPDMYYLSPVALYDSADTADTADTAVTSVQAWVEEIATSPNFLLTETGVSTELGERLSMLSSGGYSVQLLG